MKFVFACRDGYLAKFISNKFASAGIIDSVLVESGRHVRRRKIKRQFARASLLARPLVAVDLFALAIYGKICARNLRRSILQENGYSDYPCNVERFDVDDINEPAGIDYLSSVDPDVLIVLGTAILKAQVIAIPRLGTLNIHGGIVPQYRNVHSEFWAYCRKEPELIGTSILFLDEGVDTGDIVRQKTIDFEETDGLLGAKRKNAELAASLILETINEVRAGSLSRTVQSNVGAGTFPTPRASDFLRLLFGRTCSR
jgi:folate-dependent phosphoribosylglycinamide formyltransferase PurN